ncbi:hypothetical protein QC761_0086920 [Podospora bellae-mahoneyi]|uniref:Uncharacterized protein n=1 Tax=Podospora bellae-mahoneyi TaxID=2093777 RepID=A0ABR0FIE8_9PEZI|nr:hypothetical protein QC761_0086920 [Podospora bellae-mahoneyi]
MICIGVPVVRPLYKGFINKLISRATRSTSGYKKQAPDPPYGLKTFGGSPMPGASQWQATDGKEAATDRMKGHFTNTKAVGGKSMPDNTSDEEILGEYRAEVKNDAVDGGEGISSRRWLGREVNTSIHKKK